MKKAIQEHGQAENSTSATGRRTKKKLESRGTRLEKKQKKKKSVGTLRKRRIFSIATES